MTSKTQIKMNPQKLETYCEVKGMRYTPSRRNTLAIIASSQRPIGAYGIIEELGKITDKPKPATVYRAIEFLLKHGFIHRIESLKAYVVCNAGHSLSGSQFIVCKDCGSVEEIHINHLPNDLKKKVEAAGFKMDSWNTEIHGVCQRCKFPTPNTRVVNPVNY